MKTKNFFLYMLLPMLLLMSSCKKELLNPNAATDEQILKSTDGLLGMVNGMKFSYSVGGASGLYAGVSANGLSTNELQILNAGNSELAQLGNGGDNVSPDNGVLKNLWTNLNLLNANAEKVLNNAPSVIKDAGTKAGVMAYAHFFKALALGTMAQYWENVPLRAGVNATYSSREDALAEAISNLESATSVLGTDLSASFTKVVSADIDIKNSVLALSARYHLMLGQYAAAKTAAQAVDLTSKSVFAFDNVNANPVFRSSLTTQNVYDVNPNFGLPSMLNPVASDGRIGFYLTPNAESGKGFFTSDDASVPVYLPGEMMLIIAEAEARLTPNDMTNAVAELNKVLMKNDDIFNVNANLPTYSGDMTQDAVLLEIYKNRSIELYMSGLKLDDSRRFGRPGPTDADAERNRNFYPYPTVERDNNPNTPADPVI